ncbi:MAG: FAD synthetase family protein [Treponema sp.]|jgi:riboflavin kinase/FMN adenylyltransferase|nr:FAD synthetase family protein [Treponema sp.]
MSLEIIDWKAFLECPTPESSAITVGVFDGVHLGHRALIELIVHRGPNPTVISFRENPKKIISPDSYDGDIFSLSQKVIYFERLGVSRLVLIDFSENFSKLNGWEFFNLLEDRGKMAFLAVGSGFRCGFQQKTGANFIKMMNERKGIPTEVVPPVEAAAGPVSSSRIIAAIISGDLALAAALMGRNFELELLGVESTDFKPVLKDCRESVVYDLRSVRRIVPMRGQYQVMIHPGGNYCRAEAENGKVFLQSAEGSIENADIQSIEFV